VGKSVDSIGPFNIHTPYWRCFYNVLHTYDELYYDDFTSATWEFCYPCWTFTVKLHNCGCSYCVATGCSQDRKEAQQQQQAKGKMQKHESADVTQ